MARRDYVLLSVPAVIGGIIILAIFFLDIQLANFQKAYFRELANETRRNNALIVRACRELIAAGVPSIHFYTVSAVNSIREVAKQIF